MPYVNVQIVEDENTAEKKAALVRGITQVIVDVLGRRPDGTYVVIQEVPADSWGIGYQTIAARRAEADERPREEEEGEA